MILSAYALGIGDEYVDHARATPTSTLDAIVHATSAEGEWAPNRLQLTQFEREVSGPALLGRWPAPSPMCCTGRTNGELPWGVVDGADADAVAAGLGRQPALSPWTTVPTRRCWRSACWSPANRPVRADLADADGRGARAPVDRTTTDAEDDHRLDIIADHLQQRLGQSCPSDQPSFDAARWRGAGLRRQGNAPAPKPSRCAPARGGRTGRSGQ